jgi:DNA-binding GntR family transcriptional regulator
LTTDPAVPLVDMLAAQLHARVLSGEYPSGYRLPQDTIAAEFGVSRTPVREALRKLQALGIVDLQPNRGSFVRGPSAREIRDAYLVRAELEGLAAELAARWINDDLLDRLRRAERLFERSVRAFVGSRRRAVGAKDAQNDQWIHANDSFHEVVHEAAGNEYLTSLIVTLHRRVPRSLTWRALSSDSRLLKENVTQHTQIREAIERHDPEAARALMTAHVRTAGELVAMTHERQESYANASA